MAKEGKRQKGAVNHAEGQHGDKTHSRFIEQLHEGSERNGPGPREMGESRVGGSHIHEGRQQHDEADKNAEKNRLGRDIERDRLNREDYQVQGGTERHPAQAPENKPPRGDEEE